MNFSKKYKMVSVQAKASIWFVFCSFLQKGISFITVPIFTRLLTTEEYGTYSLYLSWLQIITIITSLNLFNGVLDNAMSKYEEDRDRFISAMQGLTITLTTVAFIIYLAASNFWSHLLGLAPVYILLMFIEMYVRPSMLFWSGKQRFEYKYKQQVFTTLTKSIVNPVLGLVMVYTMADRSFARVLSIVIVEVIFCGFFMILQFARGKTFYNAFYWKYGLKLAIPMLPHYLAGTILNQGDRVMIEKMVNKSAVAFYSVAYSIGMLVQIFTSAINSAITPWVYQKMKNKENEGVAKTFNGLLVFVAGISIALMLVSPELMLIFGSSEYVQGAYVIPPVAASVYFIFLYYLFSLPQFFFEKTKFLFIASLAAAVLNLGLNYIFINLYGYVAAGYTTLACYVAYSIGHYLVSKRVLGHFMDGKSLFDVKTIVLISIVLIGFGIGVNYIFDFRILRFAILVAELIVAFILRKRILQMFKKKKAAE